MLPSKSCKTINANFLLKNFGLTFFDRFKTGTYLVNWFGRGSADRTWRFGGFRFGGFRFGGSAEPCRTSKFGRYRCRCQFIGRSLVPNVVVELERSWVTWIYWVGWPYFFYKVLSFMLPRRGYETKPTKVKMKVYQWTEPVWWVMTSAQETHLPHIINRI